MKQITVATSDQRATQYVKDIRAAVKRFGEYSYEDKGPRDVMRLPTEELKALSVEEVEETLRLVIDKDERYGEKFVATVLVDLDTWDKFDDLMKTGNWLSAYY